MKIIDDYNFNIVNDNFIDKNQNHTPIYSLIGQDLNDDNLFNLLESTGNTFCGSIYNGIYKDENLDYNPLNDVFSKDFTLVFELHQEDCHIPFSGTTINDNYPKNKGLFFYIGPKEDDIKCGSENYDPSEDLYFKKKNKLDENNINPFLYYVNKCDTYGDTYYYEEIDCDLGLEGNIFSARITDNGEINIRYVSQSGACEELSFISDTKVIDYYSEPIFTKKEWNQLIFRVKNNDCLDNTIIEIFLNEKFIDKITIKKINFDFTKLYKNFHIFLKGKSNGLEFSGTTNVDDISLCEYHFCYAKDYLNFINGIVLNEEIILNNNNLSIKDFLNDIFEDNLTYVNKEFDKYEKFIINSNENLSHLMFDNEIYVPLKKNCINIERSTPSNIIKECFNGTFEGEVCDFKIYNQYLSYQQINNLYENLKIKKGIIEESCCD